MHLLFIKEYGFWQEVQQAAEAAGQHGSAAPQPDASQDVATTEALPDGPGDREAAEETEFDAGEDSSLDNLPAIGGERVELQVPTAESRQLLRCDRLPFNCDMFPVKCCNH